MISIIEKNKYRLSHNSPKVSVIVSTYRRSETLKKALLSLLTQTYSNLEIIIVDDNANIVWNHKVKKITDEIKSIKNIDIIYIQNKKNKGSAETRNIGIKQAKGEYITFLDDDDLYLPDKVINQVGHMITEESDFSLTDLWIYDEKDNLIEKRIRDYIEDYSTESLFRYHLMYHMTGTDVMMFKKKYLFEIGLFSPINVGDEFYLIQKAIKGKGIFSYLPGCDVKAYVHTETGGLSSGDGKIRGENELYEYKKKYFNFLTNKQIRYIKMRHYAVLGFAELRRKKWVRLTVYAFISFLKSPLSLLKLTKDRILSKN